MGSLYSQRQLTLSFAIMAFLAVSAMHPTRQFSAGARNVKEEVAVRIIKAQPGLDGMVSVRPSCIGRCEKCTPCTPVLVSVPPKTNMPLEYYPETWKCKCGDKLYDP
ncbi:hypothetical protein CASFOL_024097 [Castilleja foliolosa]|uniref:Epidermal patterning factor-like protein n=1 Tax=Castilleja foliolosa TaxID=1961234 RepID=A0ABD3CN96_9LAMI